MNALSLHGLDTGYWSAWYISCSFITCLVICLICWPCPWATDMNNHALGLGCTIQQITQGPYTTVAFIRHHAKLCKCMMSAYANHIIVLCMNAYYNLKAKSLYNMCIWMYIVSRSKCTCIELICYMPKLLPIRYHH